MRIFAFSVVALALVACSRPDHATAPDTPVPTVEPIVTEAAALEPEIPATLPPLPSDKPEVPSLPLSELVGMDDSQVLAVLGQPDRREDRSPGVAWVYDGTGCRFGLLLYPDLETDKRTVLSVETEGDGPCSARMATP